MYTFSECLGIEPKNFVLYGRLWAENQSCEVLKSVHFKLKNQNLLTFAGFAV